MSATSATSLLINDYYKVQNKDALPCTFFTFHGNLFRFGTSELGLIRGWVLNRGNRLTGKGWKTKGKIIFLELPTKMLSSNSSNGIV